MSRLNANLLLLITAMVWGLAFVAQQTSMESVGPFYFTGIRFLLGGLVILPWALREVKKFKSVGYQLTKKDWAGMVLCGVFMFLASITQQEGMDKTSVTNAGFFTGMYVILTPLILLIFWRKMPHWSIWPSAIGCLIGAYYLSGGGLTAMNVGDMWMLVSAVFWALQIITVGFVVRSSISEAPVLIATVQFLSCAVFSFIGAPFFETFDMQGVMAAWMEILYAGILSVGLGFTLQVVAQRYTGQADAAIIMSGEMLFAATFGAILLGERLDVSGYIGCGIMFISILSVELLPILRKSKREQAA